MPARCDRPTRRWPPRSVGLRCRAPFPRWCPICGVVGWLVTEGIAPECRRASVRRYSVRRRFRDLRWSPHRAASAPAARAIATPRHDRPYRWLGRKRPRPPTTSRLRRGRARAAVRTTARERPATRVRRRGQAAPPCNTNADTTTRDWLPAGGTASLRRIPLSTSATRPSAKARAKMSWKRGARVVAVVGGGGKLICRAVCAQIQTAPTASYGSGIERCALPARRYSAVRRTVRRLPRSPAPMARRSARARG